MTQHPSRIPVMVLSGFLGSGKTTLLNRLIKLDGFRDAAVIINEFGEIGLDHHLVESADDTIIELSNGCLCCTVRGQLVDTLEDLVRCNPSRIVIETTGLADPGPVIQAIIGTPAIRSAVRFAGLYTVFDCLHGIQRIDQHREALLQVSLADLLILTKLDCLDEGERSGKKHQAIEFLKTLNPDCRILTSDAFLADPGSLQNRAPAQAIRPNESDEAGHHHHHDVSVHNERISALTLSHDQPVSLHQITMFLDLLLSAHGRHILRLKGLADIVGENRPTIIQAVGGTLSDFDHLDAWPDGEPRTRLVVFTDGLDRHFVQKLFDGFMNIPAIDTPDKKALEANPLAIPGAGSTDFR